MTDAPIHQDLRIRRRYRRSYSRYRNGGYVSYLLFGSDFLRTFFTLFFMVSALFLAGTYFFKAYALLTEQAFCAYDMLDGEEMPVGNATQHKSR